MEFAASYSYTPSLMTSIDRSTMPREAYLELIDYISYNSPDLSPAPGIISLPPHNPVSYMPYYPQVAQYQPQQPPPSYMPYHPQVPQVSYSFIPVYYRINLVADEERSYGYEDLLDLEEQMGRVNVGLSEETITKNLKTSPVDVASKDKEEGAEICVVCQDEYKLNETVGMLQCGHCYHANCIKEWLLQKNVCPICKAKALIIP